MLGIYLSHKKIYDDIKINFFDNILSKEDLKILFAKTYEIG